MERPQSLSKAINGLLFNHPFFASVLLKQRIEEDNSKPTFSVDGTTLRFNRGFCESLKHEEIMGVLMHEILHLTSFHHARAKGRDHKKWNKACDYAINPIVIQSGARLPKGVLIDPAFTGKTAEEIYRLLPADSNKDQSGNEPSFGEVEESPDATPAQAEEKAAIQTKQAMAQAKSRGQMPGHIERAIADVLPRIDWREALARFVSERVNADSSWNRPNRRFAHSGLILPSLYSETIGNVVFACDTSGSISAEEVNLFASELLNALQTFEECGKVAELTAIYCDAEVKRVETLTPFDRASPLGGGGTDFKPPFAYIEEHQLSPIAVVYMTDGHCGSFPDEPAYPVLWAVIGSYHSFKPPFGEVLLMDINS